MGTKRWPRLTQGKVYDRKDLFLVNDTHGNIRGEMYTLHNLLQVYDIDNIGIYTCNLDDKDAVLRHFLGDTIAKVKTLKTTLLKR